MGSILSYETTNVDSEDKFQEQFTQTCNYEDLESKINDLETLCRNLENRITNLEKNRRTIYL